MAKQQSHHSLVDREDLAHLLPSIKLMIIAKEKSHIQDNHTTNKVSQNKTVQQVVTCQYTIQAFHISSKHVLIFQTIHDSNSTHPNTYSLVRFSGCLHLWWIPLLTPELCVTSVTMNQFPHAKGQPLRSFRPPATLTTIVSPL